MWRRVGTDRSVDPRFPDSLSSFVTSYLAVVLFPRCMSSGRLSSSQCSTTCALAVISECGPRVHLDRRSNLNWIPISRSPTPTSVWTAKLQRTGSESNQGGDVHKGCESALDSPPFPFPSLHYPFCLPDALLLPTSGDPLPQWPRDPSVSSDARSHDSELPPL